MHEISDSDEDRTLKIPANNDLQTASSAVPVKRKRRTKDEIAAEKAAKDSARAAREAARIAKRQAIAEEKARKASARAAKKALRPEECLRHLRVHIDSKLMQKNGFCDELMTELGSLEGLTVTYSNDDDNSRKLPLGGGISWFHDETPLSEFNNWQRYSNFLVILTAEEFSNFFAPYYQSATDSVVSFVKDIQQQEDCAITLAVFCVDKLFRGQKNAENRAFRERVLGLNAGYDVQESKKTKSKKTASVDQIHIRRLDVEEISLAVQLECGVSLRFLDTASDVANCVRCMTKAIAQQPSREGRLDSLFSFQAESTGGVKICENGAGVNKLWRQQLMQIGHVSSEMTAPIIDRYPTPRHLLEAYALCTSEKQGASLLADLQIERGSGVLRTTRRVGKELSRRVYQVMTSINPNFVIE